MSHYSRSRQSRGDLHYSHDAYNNKNHDQHHHHRHQASSSTSSSSYQATLPPNQTSTNNSTSSSNHKHDYHNQMKDTIAANSKAKIVVGTKSDLANGRNANVMSATSNSDWLNFFQAAGIPDKLAHDYSLIFLKHRIRTDMLMELNKEILGDMGIKTMGDVIAILRHAKTRASMEEVANDLSTNNNKPIMSKSEPNKTFINKDALQHQIDTDLTGSRDVSLSSTRPSQNPSFETGSRMIRSRISLNSGALKASSGEKYRHTNDVDHANHHANSKSYHEHSKQDMIVDNTKTQTHNHNNKRLSSATSTSRISESLSKRLCPEVSQPDSRRRLEPEKTLVVTYPSKAAIARARQRISGNPQIKTDRSPQTSSKIDRKTSVRHEVASQGKKGSIKSRLGQISLKEARHRR